MHLVAKKPRVKLTLGASYTSELDEKTEQISTRSVESARCLLNSDTTAYHIFNANKNRHLQHVPTP